MEKTVSTEGSVNHPVAILAGGLGTRLSEETSLIPKPMVEIGGRPILWHIMKIYSYYGFKEFVIALGYKGSVIKDYFLHYMYNRAEKMVLDIPGGIRTCSDNTEGWTIHLLETGERTQISGRIRRILEYTKQTTLLTYGDGVADIDINKLLDFHKEQGRFATVTAVKPPSRFGRIVFDEDEKTILSFDEKPVDNDAFINGGFFVLEPSILDAGEYGDDEIFERVYLPRLARMKQLSGYVHKGFWQCMDTIREKQYLNELWETNEAKWRVWND